MALIVFTEWQMMTLECKTWRCLCNTWLGSGSLFGWFAENRYMVVRCAMVGMLRCESFGEICIENGILCICAFMRMQIWRAILGVDT